mgnify:CR=1 FL=1
MIEVESEILSEVIGCKLYHRHAPKYGERAWIAKGKNLDVAYWDTGNTWCAIIDVIPKRDGKNQKEVINFYRKLKREIAKNYDENMWRID